MTQMNLHMKRNRLIDIENRPVIVKGEEIWRRDRLGFGVIRCKPQHIGWIYNKVLLYSTAAAAAKSLQSCPTLCDPKDDSPSGSTFPGILQARTLEWVAISFSNV